MNALHKVALTAHNITVMHDEFTAVNNVSLTLHAGEWVSLVGPNGAGKSSLLKALAGLIEYEGRVDLLGQPWRDWNRRIRARRLAWLGQAEPGQEDLTVYDVAMLGRLPHQTWLESPSPKDRQVVEVALRTVHAWDWRSRSLGQLSGGERQRVLLARALSVQADVILMDEPCSALDPIATARIEDLMQEIKKDYTIIIVTHNMQQAARVSDRTAFFTTEVNTESDRRTGVMVEFDLTQKMFSVPSDERTESYVTGRFG